MPSISIRYALPSDAESVSDLLAQLGYALSPIDVIRRMERCNEDFSKVFVGVLDLRVVGFLSFHSIPLIHENASLGRITAMAVHSDYHRKGIGRLLLQAVENHAISLNCSRIEVTSGDHREHDAHIFYASQGYHSDCRRFLKRFKRDNV
jgi:GNAT superfamily N-acetyltransferase